jgi:CheY-like chemotaxis protein
LVLMDIHMPLMDGLEATRLIRSREATRIPIIGLSASAFAEDYQHCQEAGMDELIAKPVRRLALLETLARFLPPGSYIENSTSYLNQAVARLLPNTTQHLLKDLDGDLNLFLTMVLGFIKETRRNLDQLQPAITNQDATVVHRLAHSIKGGALNLGASHISHAALALEQAAKQNELIEWQELFTALESQILALESVFIDF